MEDHGWGFQGDWEPLAQARALSCLTQALSTTQEDERKVRNREEEMEYEIVDDDVCMKIEVVDSDEKIADCGEEFQEVVSRRQRRWNKKQKNDEVRILQVIEPEGINTFDEQSEWEEIRLAVDSGATETVISEDMLKGIELKDGPASRRGVEYEVANGVRIPNLGEKKFVGVNEEGQERAITAQVCEVNKALLSVKKVLTAGNKVVFDAEGSFIEDKTTGERMWLKEDNGMFMLNMWVKKGQGF